MGCRWSRVRISPPRPRNTMGYRKNPVTHFLFGTRFGTHFFWCESACNRSSGGGRKATDRLSFLNGVGIDLHHHALQPHQDLDRKSTRLNSSHGYISYAVFCLKKKKKKPTLTPCTNRFFF